MELENRHLGKKSEYPQRYDSSVLVAIPRSINREQYKIKADELPFEGLDVWHAYEFSFLLESGLPVCGLLKITYTCKSNFLVESKSLKLYLNSFNMERTGKSRGEGIAKIIQIIREDLTKLLQCSVHVNYFDASEKTAANDFHSFLLLEDSMLVNELNFEDYSENPLLLDEQKINGEISWGTHLLRSNCKVTHQPDWGSVFIRMKASRLPSKEGLLKYLVSLRNENHFHEEICELIYVRLLEKYLPEELMVACMYTRRGGIDINPARSTSPSLLPENLCNNLVLSKPVFRQ